MKPCESQTLEQVLFERMGMTVEDAVATGADVVDENVKQAVDRGVQVDQGVSSLSVLLEKLLRPETTSALNTLIDHLPELAKLAALAKELPRIVATVGDVLDAFQVQFADQGIDVEKAVANGLQSLLYLGTKVDLQHLQRIGDLLASDILNPHALNVVDNAAKSLNSAQESVCSGTDDRVGMFGVLGALRDPEIQRSLAFAVQFGKCFGKNIDLNQS